MGSWNYNRAVNLGPHGFHCLYSCLDIDRIQSTVKQVAGKRLNELRHHEFDINGEPPAELRYFYDLHSEILDNPDLEWVGDMEP